MAFVLSTIVISGLNLVLIRSSLTVRWYSLAVINPSNFSYYLYEVAMHLLKIFGAIIVEVALIWLLALLKIISQRHGLIIISVLLILAGIAILLPITI